MGQEIERIIISLFPLLSSDVHFKVTSPETPNYNCIAWAYDCSENKWMEPPLYRIDGVWWPDDVPVNYNIKAYIKAFELRGYTVCSDCKHEVGFRKIALYVDTQNNCTHAARELVSKENCGKWTSKLGKLNDIIHGSPYVLEGERYGRVYCIMKQKFQ